jgi:Tol biopolymer transport system component
LAIVGALVILAGGYLWYESLSHEADNFSKDFKISEIASWSSAPGEISSSAKFSPDAKLIAFSSTRSGTKDIWVTQTNSKEAIQITKDDASNTWPIWSPDGSEIAYFSDRSTASNESGNSTGVWRISALGGTPKIVGPITSGSSELRRWTKSGNIVYAVGNTLYSMSAADGKSKKLLEIGPGEGTVQWVDISDDEKTAAFVTQKDGKWQIREIPVSGGESIEVTERDSPISDVAWQSDKGTYFFTSAENGIGQIFGIVKGSSKASQITNSATGNSVADVSSDGKSLIFSSSREDSNLWRTNTASGAEAPVVQGISSELWPSVSPDGKTIAFQSISNLDRGDKLLGGSISVAKVADPGGKQEPVAVSDSGFLPAWSPDGKWIAFRKLGEKTEKLLKVSPDGGGVKELASGLWPIGYSVSPYNRVQVSYFDWKPDGSEIAYIASENGAFNVTSVSSEGGAPRAVTKFGADGESLACPIYSPDGKSIAFYSQWRKPSKATDKDRSLWTVGAESGEAQKLYETDKVIRLLGWTEDGKGLIFAEASAFKSLPPETVIRKVSLDGGASSEIAVLENAYFYNIFLSADGSRLGYAARENNLDDIWMVPSSGGSGRKLTGNNDSETYFSSLAWAHDGSAIYFGKQTRYSLLSLITNLTE